MSNSAVEITLLGRTYSIACPPGQEETLRVVAQGVEQQLSTMKNRASSLTREEVAMMAALNIGHELYQEKMKNKQYMKQMEERIRVLKSTLDNALVERSTK